MDFFVVPAATITDANVFLPTYLQVDDSQDQELSQELIDEWITILTPIPGAAAVVADLTTITGGTPIDVDSLPPEDTVNDGVVKINSGDAGQLPGWANGDPDSINSVWQPIVYTVPLIYSTVTKWPATIASPTDADIYLTGTNTFVENPVDYQVHLWRVQFEFNKQSSQTNLEVRLQNALSGFILENFINFSSGFTDGHFAATFTTVADSASLPPPAGTGQGYVFDVRADNNSFQQSAGHFLRVESFTRISLHSA